jgi:hypothetical protein
MRSGGGRAARIVSRCVSADHDPGITACVVCRTGACGNAVCPAARRSQTLSRRERLNRAVMYIQDALKGSKVRPLSPRARVAARSDA